MNEWHGIWDTLGTNLHVHNAGLAMSTVGIAVADCSDSCDQIRL